MPNRVDCARRGTTVIVTFALRKLRSDVPAKRIPTVGIRLSPSVRISTADRQRYLAVVKGDQRGGQRADYNIRAQECLIFRYLCGLRRRRWGRANGVDVRAALDLNAEYN